LHTTHRHRHMCDAHRPIVDCRQAVVGAVKVGRKDCLPHIDKPYATASLADMLPILKRENWNRAKAEVGVMT